MSETTSDVKAAETAKKPPAHEVILNYLAAAVTPVMNREPAIRAEVAGLMCDILGQMEVPEKHRQDVVNHLRVLFDGLPHFYGVARSDIRTAANAIVPDSITESP